MKNVFLMAVVAAGLWSVASFAHSNVTGYAYDATGYEYMASGNDLADAQRMAFQRCLNESRVPRTCKIYNP